MSKRYDREYAERYDTVNDDEGRHAVCVGCEEEVDLSDDHCRCEACPEGEDILCMHCAVTHPEDKGMHFCVTHAVELRNQWTTAIEGAA